MADPVGHQPQLTSSGNCSQNHRPSTLSLRQFLGIWNQLRFHSGFGVWLGLFLIGEVIGPGSKGSQYRHEVKDGAGRQRMKMEEHAYRLPYSPGARLKVVRCSLHKREENPHWEAEEVTLSCRVWHLSPWNWAFTVWGRLLTMWT